MTLSEQSKCTPFIKADKETGRFHIKGRSMPENPSSVFTPLIEYTKEYLKNPKTVTNISFDLEYVNSTSLRYITLFIRTFELDKKDYILNIEWNSTGIEQILPPGYNAVEFFGKLCSHIRCKKHLIIKTNSPMSNKVIEERKELL